MSDPAKDPMERIADAFERIADHLEGLGIRIQQAAETNAEATQWVSDSLDDVAAAIRGEPKPEDE